MFGFVFCPFLFISAYETAQIRISGKTINIKKNPLVGVRITIKNSHDVATADSSENYSFIANENGAQILTAASTSLKPFDENKYRWSANFFKYRAKRSITELKVYNLIKKELTEKINPRQTFY